MNPILGLLGIGQPQQPQGQQTGPISPPAPWRRALGGWFDDVNGVDWQQAQQDQRIQDAVGQMTSAGLIPQELGAAVLQGVVPPSAIGQYVTQGQQHGFDMTKQDDAQAHDFAFEDHKFGHDVNLKYVEADIARQSQIAKARGEGAVELEGQLQDFDAGTGRAETALGGLGVLTPSALLVPNGYVNDGSVVDRIRDFLPGTGPVDLPPATQEQREAATALAEYAVPRLQELVTENYIEGVEPTDATRRTIAGMDPAVQLYIKSQLAQGAPLESIEGFADLGAEGLKLLTRAFTGDLRITDADLEQAGNYLRDQVTGAPARRGEIIDRQGRLQQAGETGVAPSATAGDDGTIYSVVSPEQRMTAAAALTGRESSGNPNAEFDNGEVRAVGLFGTTQGWLDTYNRANGTNYSLDTVHGDADLQRKMLAWQMNDLDSEIMRPDADGVRPADYIGETIVIDGQPVEVTYTGLILAGNHGGKGALRGLVNGRNREDRHVGNSLADDLAHGAEIEATGGSRMAAAPPPPVGEPAPFGAAQAATRPQPAPQTLATQPLGTDFMPPIPQRPAPWETPVLPMNMPQPAQQLGARPQPLGRRVAEAPIELRAPQQMELGPPPLAQRAQQQLQQLAMAAQPQVQPQRTRMVDRVVAAVEAEDERGERSSSSRETRARVRERAARRRLQARRA